MKLGLKDLYKIANALRFYEKRIKEKGGNPHYIEKLRDRFEDEIEKHQMDMFPVEEYRREN